MKILKGILGITAFLFIAIFLFFLKIISYLMGILRIGSVLCLNQKILVPVIHMYNPLTHKRVILIGVMHIANKEYYQKIQQIVDALNGYKILYEGLGKITVAEELLLSNDEKNLYEKMQRVMQHRTIIAALLKIQGQRDGLRYDDSWINTDMSLFSFIKKIHERKLNLFKSENDFKVDFKKKSDHLGLVWMLDIVFMRMSAIMLLSNLFSFFSTKKRKENQLIVKERNAIALSGIFKEVKDSNVVSIWGAAHLPGMVHELKKAGFKQKEKHWFVAYTAPKGRFKNFFNSFDEED